MDKAYEESLVRSFFQKRIQDRVLFELEAPGRRLEALSRLCHCYENTLMPKYMKPIPKPNSDPAELFKQLKVYDADDICYALSFNSDIDGLYLPLRTALEAAVGYGMPTILSCKPGHLLYFESEQGFGAPPRFILRKS